MQSDPIATDTPVPVTKSDRIARLASLSRQPFRLSIATDRHGPAIDQLRTEAYAQAGYFKLTEPQRVMTRSDPANSFCFIVSDGAQIAATMRVAFVTSRAEGIEIIEGKPPEGAVEFPGVALCRGATNKGYRGMGLMTFLVAAGVAVAFKAGLYSAIAVQAVGTPHFGAMTRAGWQSVDVNSDTMNTVSLRSARMKLVYLNRRLIAESHGHSERLHADLLQYLHAAQAIADGVKKTPTGIQQMLKVF